MHSVVANIRQLFLVASDCNFPHPLSRVQQLQLLLMLLMDDAAGKTQVAVLVVVVIVKKIVTVLGKPQIDAGSGEWRIRVVVEEEMNGRREEKGGTVVGVTLQEGAGAHHQHCC